MDQYGKNESEAELTTSVMYNVYELEISELR